MGKAKKAAKSVKESKQNIPANTPVNSSNSKKIPSTVVSHVSQYKKGKPVADNKSSEKTARKKIVFLANFIKNKAIISPAARATGISRRTVLNWKKDDKLFAEQFAEAESVAVEYVESKMLKQIDKGNATLTIFYLVNRSHGRWENTQKVEHRADESQVGKVDQLLERTAKLLKLSKKLPAGVEGSDNA